VIIICSAYGANYEPTRRHGLRCRKRGCQGVVLAASEKEGVRIRTSGCGDCLEWFRHLKCVLTQLDQYV
jgi:hypothetical protein